LRRDTKLLAKRVVFTLFCLLLAFSLGFLSSVVWADQGGAANAISSAMSQLVSCYDAMRGAEAVGANVTSLTGALNEAGLLLSQAEFAFSNGDFGAAQDYAVQSQGKLANLASEANALLIAAWDKRNRDILVNVVGSTVGTVAVLVGSWGLWSFLKKRSKSNGGREIGSAAV
jgi:hypothetical protein